MAAPVHQHEARSRQVYLPRGAAWYDFNTGQLCRRAYYHSALHWRGCPSSCAGAIVPTGPAVQHTAEALDGPLTLNVYLGADGAFDYYEDEGVNYNYEQGAFARIPLSWNERARTLTIGAREGSYPGMAAERTIHVRFIDGRGAAPWMIDAAPQRTITYTGASVTVRR